jgi:putative endonuclease
MPHFVYIIRNFENILYKGYSTDVKQRVEFHNSGKSNYTKNKGPWNLVFLMEFTEKTDALKFEKMLKRQNHKYLDWLIASVRNEITSFK